MYYTALNLSKYVTNKCIDDGHPISNLQLQKILYYIQKYFLQTKKKVAFVDDTEAWQFGPVVPKVYYRYCGYGAMPITIRNGDVAVSEQDVATINKIVEEKRTLMPWDMVAETHKPGGAWAEIYNNGNGNRKVIPTKLIQAVG